MVTNYYESETPHFFKVIVEEDLQKNSLIVPGKFVRKYGTNLSSLVHLKVPTGDVFAVQLESNHDGILSLRNGWADFVNRCCIRFGYFLVFRYEGNSMFHVVVFDVTACEIEYPVGVGKGKRKPLMDSDKETEEVFQSAESSDDDYVDACATAPSHLPFSSRGMAKMGEKEAGVIEELSHDEGFDAYADGGRKNPLFPCRRFPKKLRTEPRATDPPKAESDDALPKRGEFAAREAAANESVAYQRAASFHSEGPSAIVVVRSLQRLYLPKTLLMMCFPDRGKYSDIKVSLTDGRTWTFRISKEKRFPRFGRGWYKFIVENHLRAGDVCLFELIASAEAHFRVFIFHEEGVENPHSSPTRQRVVSSQENAARESASHEGSQRLNYSMKLDSEREFLEPYPFFQVVVGKSFEKQPLHIKKSFAERHLKGILGEDGTLECGGNSRPCKLHRYNSPSRRETVLRGWQEFQRENGFKVGDNLLIQLLNRENGFVFRVSNL